MQSTLCLHKNGVSYLKQGVRLKDEQKKFLLSALSFDYFGKTINPDQVLSVEHKLLKCFGSIGQEIIKLCKAAKAKKYDVCILD